MIPLSLPALIAQMATLELLQAMYPSESTLDARSNLLVQSAQDRIVRLEKGKGRAAVAEERKESGVGGIELSIELRIDTSSEGHEPGSGSGESTVVVIIVTLSLSHPTPESNATNLEAEQPISSIRTNQPTWLSRSSHFALQQSIQHRSIDPLLPDEEKEAYSLVQFAQTSLEGLFAAYCDEMRIAETEKESDGRVEEGGEEVRVWFWFPSLSTREKRDDMVNWAPQYGLSGWVLAGKPGVLCLEGTSSKINDFMSEIKSVSWSDIPSFQKKVSERYRTPIENGRIFEGMIEITGLITQGGGRGNRGDMGELRDWMRDHGVGEEFGEVVGGGQF